MILRQCTREPASLGLIVRYCIPYLALTYAGCKRRWKDRYQIHEGRRDREQRTSKTVLEIKDKTRETRISVATPVLRKTSHPLSGTCAVLRAGRYNTYQITSSHARDNVPASFFTASLQSAHILVCPPRPVVCPPQSFAVTTYRLHDMTEHEHHPCRTPMHIHPTC
jgi:hypothetical protein